MVFTNREIQIYRIFEKCKFLILQAIEHLGIGNFFFSRVTIYETKFRCDKHDRQMQISSCTYSVLYQTCFHFLKHYDDGMCAIPYKRSNDIWTNFLVEWSHFLNKFWIHIFNKLEFNTIISTDVIQCFSVLQVFFSICIQMFA